MGAKVLKVFEIIIDLTKNKRQSRCGSFASVRNGCIYYLYAYTEIGVAMLSRQAPEYVNLYTHAPVFYLCTQESELVQV